MDDVQETRQVVAQAERAQRRQPEDEVCWYPSYENNKHKLQNYSDVKGNKRPSARGGFNSDNFAPSWKTNSSVVKNLHFQSQSISRAHAKQGLRSNPHTAVNMNHYGSIAQSCFMQHDSYSRKPLIIELFSPAAQTPYTLNLFLFPQVPQFTIQPLVNFMAPERVGSGLFPQECAYSCEREQKEGDCWCCINGSAAILLIPESHWGS